MVEVVSIEEAGYYSDSNTVGNTVTVTLKRNNEYARCEGVLIVDEESWDAEQFDIWVQFAEAGVAGFEYWVA